MVKENCITDIADKYENNQVSWFENVDKSIQVGAYFYKKYN